MKKSDRQAGKLLVDLFWNLVLMALVVGTGYVLYTRGYLDPYLKKADPYVKKVLNKSLVATPAGNAVAPASVTPPEVAVQTPATVPSANTAPAPAPASPVAQPQTPAANVAAASASQPAPTAEQPIDLENLDRRYVPQQVKLLKGVEFPVSFNGKVVGSASVQAGIVLKLVSIQGNQVEVQEGNSTKLIPATDTDVTERVRVLMRVVSTAPATTAPTPVPTPWTPTLKGVH